MSLSVRSTAISILCSLPSSKLWDQNISTTTRTVHMLVHTNHVIMPIPDNDLRASKLALPALATPLQDHHSCQMPLQLLLNTSERVSRQSRPATASILDGPSFFVLPGPFQDPLVCTPSFMTNHKPTLLQPTPPSTRTDPDASDPPMNGMRLLLLTRLC